MSKVLTNFRFLVENNHNPLFIFTYEGRVQYFNHSAEFLAGMNLSHKLFRLAMTYAPQNFGSRTVYIDLNYGMDNFYAITVLYENEEELCIYLYRKPRTSIPEDLSLDGYHLTDINILLEANIELFKIKYNKRLTLFTDYSLPKFQIQQNSFSLLLRKIFEQYYNANRIDITLKIKIGETIMIKGKKYPIVVLIIKSDNRKKDNDNMIEKLTLQNYTTVYFQGDSISLEIPCIGLSCL